MTKETDTPLAQAVGIGFRAVALAVVVLAIIWLCSGIRSIEPSTRAVVLRWGAMDREVASGLVLAWPRPFETVVTVPAPERQISLDLDLFDDPDLDRSLDHALADGMPPLPLATDDVEMFDGRHFLLTGDADLVQLRATLVYAVHDARAYALMQERVESHLRRAFQAAVTAGCAARPLEALATVWRDAATGSDATAAAQRELFRTQVLAALNTRLDRSGCGVRAQRLDLNVYVPRAVQDSYAAAATASAQAAAAIAEARTAAATTAQEARRDRSRIVTTAEALGRELLSRARVDTDRIAALAGQDPGQRRLLLHRLHQEALVRILAKAPELTAVDGSRPLRLQLPAR